MFSVIIPVYNKAFCISTTLNSVLEQTYANFEVILVDDGSTDNSIDIINTYSDPRIRLIQQQNAGVSVARNKGIESANSEWICFLDADDWWHPDFLAHLTSTIHNHPDANCLATKFYAIPDKHHWKPEPWPVDQSNPIEIINDLPKRWMQAIPFNTCSVCANKSALLSLNYWFKPKQHNGEDLDLWFRLAENHPIYLINEPLVAYRTEQTNSLTSQHKYSSTGFHIIQLQQRLDNHLVPHSLIASSQRFIIQDVITRARYAVIQAHRWQAIKLLWSAKSGWMTKRFIVTLVMLFMPSSWVANWQQKRSGRMELA